MNKKILAIFPIAALLLSACGSDNAAPATTPAKPKPTTTIVTSSPNSATSIAVTSNRLSSNPPTSKFKQTSSDDQWIYYDGTATVSGQYFESGPDSDAPEILCFTTGSESSKLIPIHPDVLPPWFCFSDQSGSKKLFKIDDKTVFDGTTKCALTGSATIEISHFKQNTVAGNNWDYATLDKVVSSEPFKKQCTPTTAAPTK